VTKHRHGSDIGDAFHSLPFLRQVPLTFVNAAVARATWPDQALPFALTNTELTSCVLLPMVCAAFCSPTFLAESYADVDELVSVFALEAVAHCHLAADFRTPGRLIS
jgi:hypothetical protein